MHRLLVLLAAAGCGSSQSPKGTPATATTSTSAIPCFPDRTKPLEAMEIYKQLEKHAMGWMMPVHERAPPEPYGTCQVANSQIKAADGTLVAEVGCGVRILVPGIKDDLGLMLGAGARGQDVLDRSPDHPPMTCWANGPAQSRCRFDRLEEADSDTTSWVVAGSFPGDALTGADALAFFAPKPLVELDVSIWCH